MFFKKKWALVLSGGGAKGMAHIGVLKFLDELGVKPGLIVGTSVGAILGGFYACGMSGREIEDFIIKEFNYRDYFDIKTLHLPDNTLTKALQAGETIKNLFSRSGVDSGSRIYNKVRELTGEKKFGEENITFRCNSVDIVNQEHVVHRSGKIADAIKASMSVPGFFSPCKMDGKLLVDGGVYENMAVSVAREEGFSDVIAVNLNNYNPVDVETLEYGIDVIIEALFVNSRIRKREGIHKPDLEIIATDGRRSEDFSNPGELIQMGYEKAAEQKKEVVRITVPFLNFFNKN